jgi:hypothetical protein
MSRGALLLVLLAFAAGGAFGFAIGTGTDDGAEAPVSPEPGPPGSRRPRTAHPEEYAPADSDLTRALSRLGVPEAASGSGRIEVFVHTEEGEPLPGVLVRAAPVRERYEDPVRSGRVPEDPPLEDLVRELAVETLLGRSERVEAVTGADGACELVGLADLPYEVAAYLEGWSFRGETETTRVRSGSEVRFRAADRARLELTVLLPDGTEPVVADVQVSGKIGTGQRRWTPSRREAWVPPDVWTVTVTAGEVHEFRSSPVDVFVPPEGMPEPVTIRLDPRTGIRGRVVLPEGDLGAAGKLRACRLLEGEGEDTRCLLDGGRGQDVTVGRDGSFVLLDLAAGTWVIGMVTGGEVVGRTVVEVTSGLASCVVALPDPDPEGSVIVTVLGPDGKRDDRVSVVSELVVGEQRWAGPPGVPIRAGGFRVAHARPGEGASPGEASFTLVVRSRLYGESRVPYGGPGERQVEVRLEEPASLNVKVTGYTEGGHAGHVRLILVPPAGAGGSPYWQTDRPPDAQGRYVVPGIPPGDYRLVVQAMLDKSTRIPALVESIMVTPGENRIEIAMPRLYSLTIRSDTAARFGLRPPLDSPSRWRCPPRALHGGRVVWEHLPAGDYRIQPEGPSRRGIPVSVPRTREVEYDPRPDDCIVVRITDPAGILAGAGLLDGDLIVAIDGTELTDSRQMQALATLAMKNEEAAITVLRDGKRLELSVALSDWRAWGGRLEHGRR